MQDMPFSERVAENRRMYGPGLAHRKFVYLPTLAGIKKESGEPAAAFLQLGVSLRHFLFQRAKWTVLVSSAFNKHPFIKGPHAAVHRACSAAQP
jgi:hypothetical protein